LEFTNYNAGVAVGWSVFLHRRKIISILKRAMLVVVNFYRAGVVTRDRRIGSWDRCFEIGNIFSHKWRFLTQITTTYTEKMDHNR
jgi:hypothetical protein